MYNFQSKVFELNIISWKVVVVEITFQEGRIINMETMILFCNNYFECRSLKVLYYGMA